MAGFEAFSPSGAMMMDAGIEGLTHRLKMIRRYHRRHHIRRTSYCNHVVPQSEDWAIHSEGLVNTVIYISMVKGPKVEEMQDSKVNLKDVKCAIDSLSLAATRIGNCVVLFKSDFDITISGEPHIAIMLLLNLKTGQYIARVW